MKDKAYIGDEIVEGNKIIAEFMGVIVMSTYTAANGKDYSSSGPVESVKDWSKVFLKYHSSWDWLIQAWYKFLCVADEVLGLEKNERYRNDTYRIFHNCIDNNNCERAAMFLVERITWYNQNKQS